MDKKDLLELIDDTIKSIWKNEIKYDYDDKWLLKEDTLKNAFYFHLRTKLGKLFDKNDVRIFTEFTDDKFKHSGYCPDMVIAKMEFDKDEKYFGNCVKEILCVIEFKFKNGYYPSNTIYEDYQKLHNYVDDLKIGCKLYMATIWEYEDDPTNWERKNSAWAKNRLTELNASIKRNTTDMQFYIFEHKDDKIN